LTRAINPNPSVVLCAAAHASEPGRPARSEAAQIGEIAGPPTPVLAQAVVDGGTVP
jgi:hypothetical protein